MGIQIPFSTRPKIRSSGSMDLPPATTSQPGIKLAPDVAYPDNVNTVGYISVALTTSSSLSTALSLTGKFMVDWLRFSAMTAESTQVKLTVDGTVIWDDTSVGGTTMALFGMETTSSRGVVGSSIRCDTSFLLEISKATDTAVTFDYLARPIL